IMPDSTHLRFSDIRIILEIPFAIHQTGFIYDVILPSPQHLGWQGQEAPTRTLQDERSDFTDILGDIIAPRRIIRSIDEIVLKFGSALTLSQLLPKSRNQAPLFRNFLMGLR